MFLTGECEIRWVTGLLLGGMAGFCPAGGRGSRRTPAGGGWGWRAGWFCPGYRLASFYLAHLRSARLPNGAVLCSGGEGDSFGCWPRDRGYGRVSCRRSVSLLPSLQTLRLAGLEAETRERAADVLPASGPVTLPQATEFAAATIENFIEFVNIDDLYSSAASPRAATEISRIRVRAPSMAIRAPSDLSGRPAA